MFATKTKLLSRPNSDTKCAITSAREQATDPATLSSGDQTPQAAGRKCDLCGRQEFTLLHRWDVGDRWNPASIPLSMWQCRCQSVMLHPVPTAAQLPDEGDWWGTRRKRPVRNPRFKQLRTRVQHWLFGTPRSRLLKATQKVAPGGRLLDVGCGQGGLLKLAAQHYDCVGLEPSPIAAERARQKGFPIFEGYLETADIPAASFDVVLMDSVIEHVSSPVETLKHVNRILRVGGIVMLKTPKFGGPAYRRHGAYWSGFRHGYHTYVFSGETLGRSLGLAGFEVLSYPRRDRMLDDILILWGRKTQDAAPQNLQ